MRTLLQASLTVALLVAMSSRGEEFNVGTVADLKQALLLASQNDEDDTVRLAAGNYDVSGGSMRWTPGWPYEPGWAFGNDRHALAIVGSGAATTILDGGSATRILYINTHSLQTHHAEGDRQAQVTVRGLTFQCGNSVGAVPTSSGGGILASFQQAGIVVEDCVFAGNQSLGGGGLAASGTTDANGTATVRDCLFVNNTESGVALECAVVLERNVFDNNATATYGGGARLTCSNGSVVVSNNLFTANRASMYGGGLWADLGYFPGVTGTLTNNLFCGNAALPYGRGGGLWIQLQTDATCTLVNNTLTGNRAGSSEGGAAFWARNGAPALRAYNTILWGNVALNPIPHYDDLYVTRDVGGSVVLHYNDIGSSWVDPWGSPAERLGNLAADPLFADAGHWDDGGTPADPTDDPWTLGDYHLQAGSPCLDAGTGTVPDPPGLPDSDFEGDERTADGNGDGSAAVDIGADERFDAGTQGIAVDPPSCDFGTVGVGFSRQQSITLFSVGTAALVVSDIRIAGTNSSAFAVTGSCASVVPGGTCLISVGFVPVGAGSSSASLDIDSGDPLHPTVSVPLTGTGKTPEIFRVDGESGQDQNDGSTWERAVRSLQAALLLATDGDELWVRSGTYGLGVGSPAIRVDKAVGIYGGFAGTESARGQRNALLHETLVDAGYSAQRCFHITANAVLDGLTIARGNAANYPDFPDNAGGGVYVSGTAAAVIAHCRIMGNRADYGAGICHAGSTLSVTDCVISGNAADEWGGGIYSTSELSVTGCTLAANAASGDGGGILNEGVLQLRRTRLAGNTALSGGGMLTRDGPNVSLTATDCDILDNIAQWGGGGISAAGGAVNVINTRISGNTAVSYEGGGVLGGGEFTNCLLAGNVAGGYGGGLYSPGIIMRAVVTNSTLVGNAATRGGGVSTGLGDRPAAPWVQNSILWGNTAASASYGHHVYPLAPLIRYCDIDQDDYAGSDGNIREDPRFVDASHGDYHLLAGSPCVDAADSAAVPADSADVDDDGNRTEPVPLEIGGSARFFDAPAADAGNGPAPIVDMGAHEFVGDGDGDGVPDPNEWGPERNDPGYDGNADGVADCLQANVASLAASDGIGYVTAAGPAGTSLTAVVAAGNPAAADTPPGVDFPFGFFGFVINGVATGGTAAVTLYLPPGCLLATYYRFGPEPDQPEPHWYEFLYDGQVGAEIVGSTVVLHFVDGQRGDDDLSPNGTIVDCGAPAWTAAGPLADLSGRWASVLVLGQPASRRCRVQGELVIRSLGAAPTRKTTRVGVYLSADTVWSRDDRRLCTIGVPRLAPGASLTRLVRCTLRGTPSGLHFLAIIDPSDYIPEGNESNNSVAVAIP